MAGSLGTHFTPESMIVFEPHALRDPFRIEKTMSSSGASSLGTHFTPETQTLNIVLTRGVSRPISQRKSQPYSKRIAPRDLFHIENADSDDGTCCLETCLDKAASEVSEANFIPRKPSVSATAQAIAGAPGTTKR